MKRNLLVLLFATASASMSACATDFPNTYSAEPIEAKVIDADTKAPLEGVIVTANWALISGNPGGSTPAGQLMVLETTTDKNGIFRFPGWGPLKRRQGLLLIDDPQLLLFKSGYDYQRLNNYRDGVPLEGLWKAPVRTSQWSGRTIEMKRFAGTDVQSQYKNLLSFSTSIGDFATSHADPCLWTRLPLAITTMMHERKNFEALGAKSVWDRTLDQRLLDSEPHFVKSCGSDAQHFMKEMKK